ncbi:MAG: transglycosylase family protein [Gaiellaceae bacterium]
MRPYLRLLAGVIALIAVLLPAAVASASSLRASELGLIRHYRQLTWHWQRVMGIVPTPSTYGERRTHSPSYLGWLAKHWRNESVGAFRRALRPPHAVQWLCIHRGEAAWNANTGNGYYGGLQMNLLFQRTYGAFLLRAKGTANHWTPLEQMWVAERAHDSGRGFYPWPLTARNCGLI